MASSRARARSRSASTVNGFDRRAKSEGLHESFERPVSARKRNRPTAFEDFRVRFTDSRNHLDNPLSRDIVQARVSPEYLIDSKIHKLRGPAADVDPPAVGDALFHALEKGAVAALALPQRPRRAPTDPPPLGASGSILCRGDATGPLAIHSLLKRLIPLTGCAILADNDAETASRFGWRCRLRTTSPDSP